MKIRARSLASLLILTALGAPLLAPSTAMAQGDDAMTDMARQRFQEGVAFYDAKEYAKARASFLQAYAIKKHPSVLLNLAQSELRSGYEADAAQHFDQFLRENPSSAEGERQEAERGLAAALSQVHALTVSAPAGAQLFVDNEPVGTAPLTSRLFLTPGSRLLEARQGGELTNATVAAVAGGQSSQTLAFGGAQLPPGSSPGASEAPPPGSAPQPPEEGGGSYSFSTSEPREPFLDWAKRGPVSWIGGGLFGVGLIGGVVFALTSSSNYSEADSIRDQILREKQTREAAGHRVGSPCASGSPDQAHFRDACSRWDDHASAGDTQKTLSTVGFITAGVGAAVVVGGYFLTAKRLPADSAKQEGPKGLSVAATPVLGEGFQGLSLFGQF